MFKFCFCIAVKKYMSKSTVANLVLDLFSLMAKIITVKINVLIFTQRMLLQVTDEFIDAYDFNFFGCVLFIINN